jgi:hypothetical protein
MPIRRVFSFAAVLLLLAASAQALTISAAPNPVSAGQPTTFRVGTNYNPVPASCSVTVDFGDQSATTFNPAAGNAFQSIPHTYATSGTYQATASSSGCVIIVAEPPATTIVSVTSFGISRLELAFPDGKGQATVRRNEQGLRATATLTTVGSGLLQGFWEVDGRPLLPIERHVTFGQVVTIETPAIPALPTFDPGTHLLRFVVTTPGVSFNLPTLVYTVTPEEGRPIQLQGPLPQAILPYAPASFGWHAQSGAGHYELRFMAADGTPVFAALTKTPDYRLTDLALRKFFAPGSRYLWQVTAFDADGRPAGESQPVPFGFQGIGGK